MPKNKRNLGLQVEKIKLRSQEIKKNIKGNVFKYLISDKKFNKISEVYFSIIKKNKIKAWKKNLSAKQFLYVFKGKVEFVVFDDRSHKLKKIKKYFLGPNLKYSKILIPKNVWYGFKGIGNENIIVNSLSIRHNKCKMVDLNHKNKLIPFIWK